MNSGLGLERMTDRTPDFRKHDKAPLKIEEEDTLKNPYGDPRPGDSVYVSLMDEVIKVSGVVRNIYPDSSDEGIVISVALDEECGEILNLFSRDPETGMVHILAGPGEYEIFGRVGGHDLF